MSHFFCLLGLKSFFTSNWMFVMKIWRRNGHKDLENKDLLFSSVYISWAILFFDGLLQLFIALYSFILSTYYQNNLFRRTLQPEFTLLWLARYQIPRAVCYQESLLIGLKLMLFEGSSVLCDILGPPKLSLFDCILSNRSLRRKM